MKEWTVQQSIDWLHKNGFGQYSATFQAECVDGSTLLGLTDDMIRELLQPSTMKQRVAFRQLIETGRSRQQTSELDQTPEPLMPVASMTNQMQCTPQRTARCLPYHYVLPQFPSMIDQALKSKDARFLSKDRNSLRTSLLQVLFDDITKFTWYPSHEGYVRVLDALVTHHPFISQNVKFGLLHSLKNKFKKERGKLQENSPVLTDDQRLQRQLAKNKHSIEGSGRKRKADQPADTLVRTKRRLILQDPGCEDAKSIDLHVRDIQREMCRTMPDLEVLKDRMARTLHQREVDSDVMDVEVFLQKYPCLRRPDMILLEMSQRYDTQPLKELRSFLYEKDVSIISACGNSPFKRALECHVGGCLEETRRKELSMNAAALLLPTLLKEKGDGLFVMKQDDAKLTPTAVFNNCTEEGNPLSARSVSISVDKTVVISEDTCMDAMTAISVVVGLYFVFGITYQKNIKNTLDFLHTKVFTLPEAPKNLRPSIVRVCGQLGLN